MSLWSHGQVKSGRFWKSTKTLLCSGCDWKQNKVLGKCLTTTVLLFYRWEYYMTQRFHQLSNTFSIALSWLKTRSEPVTPSYLKLFVLCSFVCVCLWGRRGVSLQHLPSLCAFSRVSQADNLNGSWGGQQIPFRMAARVSGEFHSALKAIWEIKVESWRFERTSCGRHCNSEFKPYVFLAWAVLWWTCLPIVAINVID